MWVNGIVTQYTMNLTKQYIKEGINDVVRAYQNELFSSIKELMLMMIVERLWSNNLSTQFHFIQQKPTMNLTKMSVFRFLVV